MTTFGVLCFVVGVVALAMLAIRRGKNTPVGGSDYLMAFVGLASVIAGLAVFFMYALHV